MAAHPVTNPQDPRHGTPNCYANYGCRCDRCREAWTAYSRERREAQTQIREAAA